MFDIATMREAFAGPGQDTRQWITHGIVEPDTTDSHSVMFMDTDGNALPNGILVMVKLVSTGNVVPCRVVSQAAGEGEAEYSPFGPGDEVLVAVSDGDERSGCYILGRMSNGSDAFPQTVSGQDVTQNSISFKRISTPYILETAATYQIRQALTGASWSIDPTGNVIFSDGEGNFLALNQSALLFQESTGTALIQIDPEKKTVAIQSGATALVLDDTNGSSFLTGGTLSITASGGGYALGHAITLEQAVNLIQAAVIALGTQAFPPFAITPAQALLAMESAIPAAVLPATSLPISGPIAEAIALALSSPPDPSGTLVGIGRPGFLI